MNLEHYNNAISKAAQEIAGEKQAMIDLLGDRVRSILDVENPSIDPAIFGLMYMEVSADNTERRDQYGYFSPFYEIQGRIFPKPVTDCSGDEVAVWKELARVVAEPHSRARYADLALQRVTAKERYEFILIAIDAYREFADSDWPSHMDRSESLVRAFELARTYRQTDASKEIIRELCNFAQKNFDNEAERSPGASLSVLEAASLAPFESKQEILDLTAKAIELFRDNGFAIESAHLIQERLATPEQRGDLYREQADFLMTEAMKQPAGMQRLFLLHEVEQFAELHNLPDLVQRAASTAEAIPSDALEMKSFQQEFQVTREELDGFSERVVKNDSLRAALVRLGSAHAISSYEKTKANAEKIMNDSVSLRLFNTQTLGEGNSILRSTASEDERLESQIAQQDRLHMMHMSIYAIDTLNKIFEQYQPSNDELEAALESGLVTSEEAPVIARAIAHYRNGDSDSCVKCLSPMIERIIRNAARSVGIPTTKLPDQKRKRVGGVKGLGEILGDMKPFITDQELHRYWRVALVETEGLNLRNSASHGLSLEFEQPDAAILIHLLCTLLPLKRESKE